MSKQQYNPAEDDVDYDELSRAVEAGEYTAGEVWSGSELRMGRPTKDAPAKSGKTPAWTGRLPELIRAEMKARVQDGSARNESELVRQALVEFFANHPREGRPFASMAGIGLPGRFVLVLLDSVKRHGLDVEPTGVFDEIEIRGSATLRLSELAADLERTVKPV